MTGLSVHGRPGVRIGAPKRQRPFRWSVVRSLLAAVAWIAIWLLADQVTPDTFDRFWLVIPLLAAYVLGYLWRETE